MTWELIIFMGITWAGSGSVSIASYPSEESCYRALAAIRSNDSPVAESGQKKSMVAYCRPLEKKK